MTRSPDDLTRCTVGPMWQRRLQGLWWPIAIWLGAIAVTAMVDTLVKDPLATVMVFGYGVGLGGVLVLQPPRHPETGEARRLGA